MIRIRLILIVSVIALPGTIQSAAAKDGTVFTGPDLLSVESAVRTIETGAARNALGFYSEADGTFVVLMPKNSASIPLPAALPDGSQVIVRTSALTAADVVAAEEAVAESARILEVPIESWFDPEQQRVVSSGSAPVRQVDAQLGAKSALVDYTQDVRVRYSRHADSPPFWGGAETMLQGHTISDCTTGFTVQGSGGFRYLVTAGHCFAGNATVLSPGNGLVQGTIRSRASFPTYDMELIGGQSYGPDIYVGSGAGAGMFVRGATDPVTGRAIYCHSGATTYEKCHHTVNSLTSGQLCDSNGCTYDLMVLTTGDGYPCMGDSGGPIYLVSSGSAYIRGMILGGNFFCSGSTWEGARWSQISSTEGVTIATP